MGARAQSALVGHAARVGFAAAVVVAFAVAVAVVLAACGDSRTSTARATVPPSFSAEADELCFLAAAHESALAPSRIASPRDLARYAAAVVPVARGFATALGRLRAPAEKAALWRRYLVRLRAQIDAEARAGRSAAGGDRAGIRRAAAAVRAADPTPLAVRLGLSQCARTSALSGPPLAARI
jgi:hypothetical protein